MTHSQNFLILNPTIINSKIYSAAMKNSGSSSVHPAIHHPNPNLTTRDRQVERKMDRQAILETSTRRGRSRTVSQVNDTIDKQCLFGMGHTSLKITTLQNRYSPSGQESR